MKAQVLLCAGLYCLALLTPGHAAYEEQAEQHSWYQQYIGRVEKALYAFKGRDRVFVSTAKSVIASLDLKDGRVVWRQVLLPEDRIEAIALTPKPAAVLSLSRKGQSLRAWHAGDGTLIWESTLRSSEVGGSESQIPGQVLALPDITGDGSTDIAVLGSNKLQVWLHTPNKCLLAVMAYRFPIACRCR